MHSVLALIEVRTAKASNEKLATVVLDKAILGGICLDNIYPSEYASITRVHAVLKISNDGLLYQKLASKPGIARAYDQRE